MAMLNCTKDMKPTFFCVHGIMVQHQDGSMQVQLQVDREQRNMYMCMKVEPQK